MRRSYLWFLQLATGALLAIGLGIHIVIMHLEDILGFFGINIVEPVSWKSMIERASSSFWLTFYIILLALVLYHGLNGLRGIILELTPSPKVEKVITNLFLVLGAAAFIFGSYVPARLFLG